MRYVWQGVFIYAAMVAVVLTIMYVWGLEELLTPLIVSAVFSLVVDTADAIIWRKVAKSSPDSLPSFHTAVSGFRMLLALAVMLVYYLVAGSDVMLPFFLVFFAFYVALMAHHAWFFTRLSKRL